MHVAKISRRHGDREYDSYLVRRSIREGRRVRHETVANVSRLPIEAIEALTQALKGVALMPAGEAFEIVRSRKHGHVEAVLTAARRLGLARLLDREPSRERDLCLAMIAGRVLEGGSKLACTRRLQSCTLGEELGVEGAVHDDLYQAMDWLLARQDQVEQRLARRHLKAGELALYDVSCSYFEGRSCPLARFGYDHGSGKRGRMQVEYGLLCDSDGRPVAIECFEGSLKDSQTLPSQVKKIEQRFGLSRVIVVADRGIGTNDNVNTDLRDGRAGVHHRAEGATNQKAGQGGRLAAVGVRRAQPGRDRLGAAASRPAAGRLPQPAHRRRARPQTFRAASGHREGPG